MRLLKSIWVGYNNILNKHTLIVQSTQTSVLLGVGDFIAQKMFEPPEKPYDYKRTFRFSIMGMGLGPIMQVWYKVLEKVVGQDKTMKSSLKKVALDQLVFSPVMLVVFMGTLNFLEGKTYRDLEAKLHESYVDIILTNWQVWPGIQILNFSVVPLQFRVLVVQVAALGWNTYLAWKLHSHKKLN